MYYKLKDLEFMVELKPRALKLRMIKVKEKYRSFTNLLYKEGNRWYIHESIVFEFDRKRKNINTVNYKSFVSISFDGSKSASVINAIMSIAFNKLKSSFPGLVIYYVIELNWSQNSHLHFLSTINPDKLNKKIVYKVFEMFGINFDMRPISNFRNLERYINKDFVFKKILM